MNKDAIGYVIFAITFLLGMLYGTLLFALTDGQPASNAAAAFSWALDEIVCAPDCPAKAREVRDLVFAAYPRHAARGPTSEFARAQKLLKPKRD